MHHGKRHKFRATAKDDSIEAFQAALADLDRQIEEFVSGNKPKMKRTKFRQKGGGQ